MYKFFLISFLTIMFFITVNAQEKKYVYIDSTLSENTDTNLQTKIEEVESNTKINDTLFIDTILIDNNIKVSADSINAWKNLNAFLYAKYLDSLLKDKQQKEKNNIQSKSQTSWLDKILSSSALQFILWMAAISFVLFVLYKLFLAEAVFTKKVPASNLNTSQVAEKIITNNSNFNNLIIQAQKAGNYRLAVRYMYLQCIYNLADKKLISLAVDKTNYQYVSELKNKNFQQNFAALTLNYEYVWYGQFTIDENLFTKMQVAFNNFNANF